MYRLFSPSFYAANPVAFEERRLFFDSLRQRQLQADPPFFSKELLDTCPCCGYPVFDLNEKRSQGCLICGWVHDDTMKKSSLVKTLLEARKTFDNDLIATPLTVLQPWLGWNTPVDLRLHMVLACAFNSMVGESKYEVLDHTLDFCHQLLTFQAFRRDVGLRLWESHHQSLENQSIAAYEFNEEEVENTFFEYMKVEDWDYLDHFLFPFHCISISYDPQKDVIFRCGVEDIDRLPHRDWLYFTNNLQVDDPMMLFLNEAASEPARVEVCDFTGKRLGYLPFLRSVEVEERLEDGEYLAAMIEKVTVQDNRLWVDIAVVAYAGTEYDE